MAPLVLLTAQQAENNKEVFERVAAKLPPAPPSEVSILPRNFDGIGNTISVGYATSRAPYPPPPNATIFSDPSLHVHAIATFFSTAMATVGFVPNSPVTPPDEQARRFNNFLDELDRYGPFLPRKESFRRHHQNSSIDCYPLLITVQLFIHEVQMKMVGGSTADEVSQELTRMVVSAVQSMGSSSSARTEKTLFSVFQLEAESTKFPYPVGIIFWSTLVLDRHTTGSGKSTSVHEYQEIELLSYGYMIESPQVVAHADELSAAFGVSSNQFVQSINM